MLAEFVPTGPEPRHSRSLLRCDNFLRVSRLRSVCQPAYSVHPNLLAIHVVAQSLGHKSRLSKQACDSCESHSPVAHRCFCSKQRSNLNQLGRARKQDPEPGLLRFVWQCLGFVRWDRNQRLSDVLTANAWTASAFCRARAVTGSLARLFQQYAGGFFLSTAGADFVRRAHRCARLD